MPELPEVQTTVESLDKLLRTLVIRDIWSDYDSVFHVGKKNIKNVLYFRNFRKEIIGRKILAVRQRGKNILIDLSADATILIHMKMTGHFLYGKYERNSKIKNKNAKLKKEEWVPLEEGPLQDPFNRFIHLVFTLSNGAHLVLSDMRRFAKILHFTTSEHHEDILYLGPEPLLSSFTFERFRERLLKRAMWPIKRALMNQELIAGIGNIYSDEMLFVAGIHPLSMVKKISRDALKRLFVAMRQVLHKGIDFRGDSTSDYRRPDGTPGEFQHHHKVYRKTDKPCPKRDCGGTIMRVKLTGRSAHFCNQHQKKF